MRYIIMLLVLAAAVPAAAQKTIYVAYDEARLYSEPDFLSDVVDTLAIGDPLTALERRAKFTHVRAGDAEGWVLTANVSETAPAVGAKPRGAAVDDAASTVSAGADASSDAERNAKSDSAGVVSASDTRNGAAANGVDDAANTVKTVVGKMSPSSAGEQRTARPRSTTAPAAESRQCAATTKSGRQCSRTAASGSAYCWQHNR